MTYRYDFSNVHKLHITIVKVYANDRMALTCFIYYVYVELDLNCGQLLFLLQSALPYDLIFFLRNIHTHILKTSCYVNRHLNSLLYR